MPDASGRIRPVSIPRVPWHEDEPEYHDATLRTVCKGPVITDWYEDDFTRALAEKAAEEIATGALDSLLGIASKKP